MDHLAGGITAGFVTTLVCHPIDLLKVRFAANEGAGHRPQYRGYVHALRTIGANGGARALYQGVLPNLVASTFSWGLYFPIYDSAKKALKPVFQDELFQPSVNLMAGIFSGVCIIMVTNPIWVVKTRLCLQYETQQRIYSGITDALNKIFTQEGVRGLYKGLVPALFGTSHGGLQLMAYDYLKQKECQRLAIPITQKLDISHYILYASVSKLFAVVCTYPYQVIRTRLQDRHAHYDGLTHVIKSTFKNEGFYGFYKGLLPTILRVIPAICITFVVYENVIHFFPKDENNQKTACA